MQDNALPFFSMALAGESWRDIGQRLLQALEIRKQEGFRPNFGFLYVTEPIGPQAASLLTLLKTVTGIRHWSGCVATGVYAETKTFTGVPAASLLLGSLPENDFISFGMTGSDDRSLRAQLESWLNLNDPMLVAVHGNTHTDTHPAHALEELHALTGGFLVGGLSSARQQPALLSEESVASAVNGIAFKQTVPVATLCAQGCVPMGPFREISAADTHVVAYLDGRSPFEAFSEDARRFIAEQAGSSFQKEDARPAPLEAVRLSALAEGNVHVAFPVRDSDMNDFTVRNILALDPESGLMALDEAVMDGQKIMFVHRSDKSVSADLSASLIAFRRRVVKERGVFAPRGALYVSCVARAGVDFKGAGKAGGELDLIRDILGPLPVAGFYAAGEISGGRLYGHTGVLTVFF